MKTALKMTSSHCNHHLFVKIERFGLLKATTWLTWFLAKLDVLVSKSFPTNLTFFREYCIKLKKTPLISS